MTQSLDTNALRDAYAAFQDVYGDASGREWRQNFASQVATVQQASAELWATPDFQEILWRAGGISSIGAGAAVSVTGAYEDADLAAYLLKLRDDGLSDDPQAAAFPLQTAFETILDWVRPRYTEKRPRARIVRLLAALYPRHMTCLMDERRTLAVLSLVGAAQAPNRRGRPKIP